MEFLPRGFGFPIHDFVRGLLFAYGIQIHDLNPNSVLSIASFIVLCECFLGIAPNWNLWKSLFMVRRMVGRSKQAYPVGGFGIQLRGDTSYFQLKKSAPRVGLAPHGGHAYGIRRSCTPYVREQPWPSRLRSAASIARPWRRRTRQTCQPSTNHPPGGDLDRIRICGQETHVQPEATLIASGEDA